MRIIIVGLLLKEGECVSSQVPGIISYKRFVEHSACATDNDCSVWHFCPATTGICTPFSDCHDY